jgi:hypothetical protein
MAAASGGSVLFFLKAHANFNGPANGSCSDSALSDSSNRLQISTKTVTDKNSFLSQHRNFLGKSKSQESDLDSRCG